MTIACSRAIVSLTRPLFIANETFVRNAWIAQIAVETARTSNVTLSSKQYQISSMPSSNTIDRKMAEHIARQMFGKTWLQLPLNWDRLNTCNARWYGRNLFITRICMLTEKITQRWFYLELLCATSLTTMNWIGKHLLQDLDTWAKLILPLALIISGLGVTKRIIDVWWWNATPLFLSLMALDLRSISGRAVNFSFATAVKVFWRWW